MRRQQPCRSSYGKSFGQACDMEIMHPSSSPGLLDRNRMHSKTHGGCQKVTNCLMPAEVMSLWHKDQKSVCALVLAIVNEAQTL